MADEFFIDANPKKEPDAAGRIFDGTVLSFAAGDDVVEVISVKAKFNESAFNQSRLTSGVDYIFDKNQKQIRLFGNYVFRLFVTAVFNVTQEQFEAKAPKAFVDLQAQLAGTIGADLKAGAAQVQAQEIGLKGSGFNEPGQVLNNLKSVFGGAKPLKNVTRKIRPTLMQKGAGDGSADVSVSTSALDALKSFTGKTTITETNTNKIVVLQGSPEATQRTFTKHLTASKQKIKDFSIASAPKKLLESNVLTELRTAVDNNEKGIKPAAKAVEKVAEEVTSKLKDNLNLAGFNLGGLKHKIVPGGGKPGVNVLPNIFAKGRGILPEVGSIGLGDIKAGVAGVASGVKVPSDIDVPNLIEGFDQAANKITLDTNFSKLVDKGNLINENIKLTNVKNTSTSGNAFAGFNTPPEYKFEVIGIDRLFNIITGCDRNKNGSIRVLTVGWTSKYAGPPPPIGNFDAKFIHEQSKKADIAFLTQEKSNSGDDASAIAQQVNKDLKDSGKSFGIQSHFIIRTDGSLQIGRPIDVETNPKYSTYNKSGVQLTFVASKDKPTTTKQMETFESFLKTFYEVIKGADVYGDYEINRRYEGPGFDLDSFRKKFQKTTTVEDPSALTEAPTRAEMEITRPKEVAKTSTSAFHAGRKFSFDKMFDDIQNINLPTGEQITTDVDAATSSMNKALSDTDQINADISAAADKSFAQAAGGFQKLQGDLDIKNLTAKLDASGASFDTNLKKIAPNSTSKAIEFGKKIF